MRKTSLILVLGLLLALFGGCMQNNVQTDAPEDTAQTGALPEIPEKLQRDGNGVPVLKVYVEKTGQIEEMDVETYIAGVLAGEMKNDWPIEALKAQAILARTFVLKFVQTKASRYEGADISTDVTEAQAYNAEKINDAIRAAVDQTRGQVMSYGGALPQAWFHAHAGGMTELPSVALDYKEDPDYLSVVESPDSDKAPEDVKHWTARFTAEEISKACAGVGAQVGEVESVSVGEKGDSGRAKTLIVNGQSVSAANLRIQLGASKLKSTLIESLAFEDGEATFTGRGYGHGVGLSQWGAYGMAEAGENAQAIVAHYYQGVEIVSLWE